MKKFLLVISFTLGLPILLLLAIYLYTDPFCTLKKFNLSHVDQTNREYLSTELFLKNKDKYHYDSFIFGSSRGTGINTYTWKMYLPNESQQYLFQAWSETLTGIELKIEYLQKNNISIRNALVLIDIPGTFVENQLPHESLTLKHYLFTEQPRWVYNGIHFCNFIQKSSLWIDAVKETINHESHPFTSDTITNDNYVYNRIHYTSLPKQDSMKSTSNKVRQNFFVKITNKSIDDIQMSPKLINDDFVCQLRNIKSIFDENNTNYQILITPGYCYTSQYINSADLIMLKDIFGDDRVHDYSTPNDLNMDYNNFIDPSHFDLHTGFIMLQEIYTDTIIVQKYLHAL